MATIRRGRIGDDPAGTPVPPGEAPGATRDADTEVAPGVRPDETGRGMSVGDGTLGGLAIGGSNNPPAAGVVGDTAPEEAAILLTEPDAQGDPDALDAGPVHDGMARPTDGARS